MTPLLGAGILLAVVLIAVGIMTVYKLPTALSGTAQFSIPGFPKSSVSSKTPGLLLIIFGTVVLGVSALVKDIYMDTAHWVLLSASILFSIVAGVFLWTLPEHEGGEFDLAAVKFKGGLGASTAALSLVLFAVLTSTLPQGTVLTISDDIGPPSCITSEHVDLVITSQAGRTTGHLDVSADKPVATINMYLPTQSQYGYNLTSRATITLGNGTVINDRQGRGIGSISVAPDSRALRVLSDAECDPASISNSPAYAIQLCHLGHCQTTLGASK